MLALSPKSLVIPVKTWCLKPINLLCKCNEHCHHFGWSMVTTLVLLLLVSINLDCAFVTEQLKKSTLFFVVLPSPRRAQKLCPNPTKAERHVYVFTVVSRPALTCRSLDRYATPDKDGCMCSATVLQLCESYLVNLWCGILSGHRLVIDTFISNVNCGLLVSECL